MRLSQPLTSMPMAFRPIPPAAGPATWPLLLLAGCVILVTSTCPGLNATAGPSAEALRLQAEFKRAKSTAERQAIAAGLLKLGAEGGRRLHAIARDGLSQQAPKYAAGFQQAVANVLRQRAGKGDPAAEIATLRKTILDAAAQPELTKQMIEEQSDPALARLEEMLVISAADVLGAAPDLAAQRAELLLLAEWAERAADLVPDKDRGKLPPRMHRAPPARWPRRGRGRSGGSDRRTQRRLPHAPGGKSRANSTTTQPPASSTTPDHASDSPGSTLASAVEPLADGGLASRLPAGRRNTRVHRANSAIEACDIVNTRMEKSVRPNAWAGEPRARAGAGSMASANGGRAQDRSRCSRL